MAVGVSLLLRFPCSDGIRQAALVFRLATSKDLFPTVSHEVESCFCLAITEYLFSVLGLHVKSIEWTLPAITNEHITASGQLWRISCIQGEVSSNIVSENSYPLWWHSSTFVSLKHVITQRIISLQTYMDTLSVQMLSYMRIVLFYALDLKEEIKVIRKKSN